MLAKGAACQHGHIVLRPAEERPVQNMTCHAPVMQLMQLHQLQSLPPDIVGHSHFR